MITLWDNKWFKIRTNGTQRGCWFERVCLVGVFPKKMVLFSDYMCLVSRYLEYREKPPVMSKDERGAGGKFIARSKATLCKRKWPTTRRGFVSFHDSQHVRIAVVVAVFLMLAQPAICRLTEIPSARCWVKWRRARYWYTFSHSNAWRPTSWGLSYTYLPHKNTYGHCPNLPPYTHDLP